MMSLSLSAAFVAAIVLVAGATRSSAGPNLAPGTLGPNGNPNAKPAAEFSQDVTWPAVLPNNWIIGEVGGLTVDSNDNIWVYHRPGTITSDEYGSAQVPIQEYCCFPAPPVLEFNQSPAGLPIGAGRVLQAWGPIEGIGITPSSGEGVSTACKNISSQGMNGPGTSCNQSPIPSYPAFLTGSGITSTLWFQDDSSTSNTAAGVGSGGEHGIAVDGSGFVWLSGDSTDDAQILKCTQQTNGVYTPGAYMYGLMALFTPQSSNGNCVAAIGAEEQPYDPTGLPAGSCPNNLTTTWVCRAAQVYVDSSSNGYSDNNVYVADGVSQGSPGGNNRVAEFNCPQSLSACTFVRAWGAYGVTASSGAVTTGYGTIPPLAATYPYTLGSYNGTNPTSHFEDVHCITRDPATGYLWVCDRFNDRVQVFTPTGGYVGQCYFATSPAYTTNDNGAPENIPAIATLASAGTTASGYGSTWNMTFLPRTGHPKGPPNEIVILLDGTNSIAREFYPIPDPGTGMTSGAQYCPSAGQFGWAARHPGQWHSPQVGDIDSKGNYFTGEGVDGGAGFNGKRLQRFFQHGGPKPPKPPPPPPPKPPKPPK